LTFGDIQYFKRSSHLHIIYNNYTTCDDIFTKGKAKKDDKNK